MSTSRHARRVRTLTVRVGEVRNASRITSVNSQLCYRDKKAINGNNRSNENSGTNEPNDLE